MASKFLLRFSFWRFLFRSNTVRSEQFHFILHVLYSHLRHDQSLQRLSYSVIGNRRGTGWRDVVSTELMLIDHRKNIKQQMLALWLTELTRFTGKKKFQHPVEKTNFCL